MWIDPNYHDTGLASFVLRVVHSLLFDPVYIDVDARSIGNKVALRWYTSWRKFFDENPGSWFPFEKFSLPVEPFISQRKGEEVAPSVVDTDNLPNRQRKFVITGSTTSYEPEPFLSTNFKILGTSDFRGSYEERRLYISPKARSKIFRHISWGDSATANQVEQGGILVGRSYRDEKTGVIYGVVEDAISGDLATGSSAYLEMGHSTWKKMIDEFDNIMYSNSIGSFQIIGWYHTHPNRLDVFMSGTDKGTQSRFFSHDWQFAIVLNPHRKIWRAFNGKDAKECRGYLLADQ